MADINPDLLAAYKGALSSLAPASAPAPSDGGPAQSVAAPPPRFVPAPEQLDQGGVVQKFLAGASPDVHARLQSFHGQTAIPDPDPAVHLAEPAQSPEPPKPEPAMPASDSAPAANAAAGLAMAIPEAGDFHAAQSARIRQAIFG